MSQEIYGISSDRTAQTSLGTTEKEVQTSETEIKKTVLYSLLRFEEGKRSLFV